MKDCLDGDETGTRSRVTRKYAMAARALERIEPGLLTEALATVVTKREEGPGLSDDELLCFTANLGDMPLAWQALPDSSHVKVYETLKNADVQQLVDHGIFACALTMKRGMPSMPGSARWTTFSSPRSSARTPNLGDSATRPSTRSAVAD